MRWILAFVLLALVVGEVYLFIAHPLLDWIIWAGLGLIGVFAYVVSEFRRPPGSA